MVFYRSVDEAKLGEALAWIVRESGCAVVDFCTPDYGESVAHFLQHHLKSFGFVGGDGYLHPFLKFKRMVSSIVDDVQACKAHASSPDDFFEFVSGSDPVKEMTELEVLRSAWEQQSRKVGHVLERLLVEQLVLEDVTRLMRREEKCTFKASELC
jgi:hypothetical protein